MTDPVNPGPTRPPAPDLRIVQANERTLLAWIRTALGIMAFGFVVARLGLWLAEVQPGHARPGGHAGASLWVGVALVAFGAASLVVAAARYTRTHAAIVTGEPHVPGTAFGVLVAVVLALGGLGLAAYLVSRG